MPDSLREQIASHLALFTVDIYDEDGRTTSGRLAGEESGRIADELLATVRDTVDEPVIADAELLAMHALLPGLPLVAKLDVDARARVMEWARHRVNDGEPPF